MGRSALSKFVTLTSLFALTFLFRCSAIEQEDPYEKAAVVWLASVIGNDCMRMESPESNYVKCRILDSLGFNSLFDEKHLDYLNHWFRNDSLTMEYFQSDPYLPLGSSSASNTILSYSINHRQDTLILNYRGAYWVHGESGEFEERSTFLKMDRSLILLENRVSL